MNANEDQTQGVQSGQPTGRCLQRSVNDNAPVEASELNYAQTLANARRTSPTLPGGGAILLVGEVLDGEAMAEALRAASSSSVLEP